jgi:hypothetical protein
MIGPEAGEAWFRLVIFLLAGSLIMILVTRPGSAEFVVSVVSLVISLIFLGILIFFIRHSKS